MRPAKSHVAVTGGNGFLGFHTRALLHSSGRPTTVFSLGDAFDLKVATAALNGAARVIHLAGVNRGTEAEVEIGNTRFAEQLAEALVSCEDPPQVVAFANSIQAKNGSAYGEAKREAAEILSSAAARVGSTFVDVLLPNLFGEHGRPFYNSVTATFCHLLATGGTPSVQENRELCMMHAQNAAELLAGDRDPGSLETVTETVTVRSLLALLEEMSAVYQAGQMPPLGSDFHRDLFNTYRSYVMPDDRVMRLTGSSDARGAFFEVIRSHEGSSQTSFSTTVPGVTRGQHYHRRKIERFSVLSGSGQISMRRLFSNEVLTFEVNGDTPVAIDMPTLWAHNVTNTGSDMLYTAFWTNELFDPSAADTYSEDV